jgi:hypothetical protein
MSIGTKLTPILKRERVSRIMDDPTVINLLPDLDRDTEMLIFLGPMRNCPAVTADP